MLVHLVELVPLEGDPVGNYELVRAELEAYGAGLERLPELVILSKRDLLEAAAVEAAVAEWTERLGDSVLGVMSVSSATGEGLEDLRRRILADLATVQPLDLAPATGGRRRIRGRAPRLPARRRGRLLGRTRGRRRLPDRRPRRRAALRTPRHQKRRSARLPRAAAHRDGRDRRPAQIRLRGRATTCGSASTSSSCTSRAFAGGRLGGPPLSQQRGGSFGGPPSLRRARAMGGSQRSSSGSRPWRTSSGISAFCQFSRSTKT